MSEDWELILVLVALVAAAISGGAFFAFSNFVMPALAKLPGSQAVSAMQAINQAAPNPAFVTAIVGAGVVGVPVAISELDHLGESAARYLIAGTILSLLSFAITMVSNVPQNTALARLDPGGPTTEAAWERYLVGWTRANTVRALTSLASVASYAMSLRAG